MAPKKDRNIRKSVMARVVSLLQSPPAGSDLNSYTVYNETQLRAVNAKSLVPVEPCVYVVDTYIKPAEIQLPLVSIEVPIVRRRPFELGNSQGRWSEVILHVFGESRGERDDLSSFLADNLGRTIPIYSYTTNASGTLVEHGEVADEIILEQVGRQSDDVRQEGSLDLWEMVTFFLQTKS